MEWIKIFDDFSSKINNTGKLDRADLAFYRFKQYDMFIAKSKVLCLYNTLVTKIALVINEKMIFFIVNLRYNINYPFWEKINLFIFDNFSVNNLSVFTLHWSQ